MLLLWNKSLETGIKNIDDQNKDLLARLNALADIRQGQRRATEMLVALERSVMKYFRAEEDIHRELAFPDAYLHKSHHKKYISMFGRFKRGYLELGPTLFNVIKFEENVELLRKHIVSFDRDFASYYHACRADFLSGSIGA